jgi:hypothetical protein
MVEIRGKDIRGKNVTLMRSQPYQLSLFQTFHPDHDKYSNSIELYDALPKYFPARHIDELRIQDAFLPNLERQFEHRGTLFKLTIRPARLVYKNKTMREFYPTFREELVEEALRKIASDRSNGMFLNEQAGAQFSLYELQKELQARGHSINLPDLLEALKICNLASLSLEQDGRALVQSPIFPILLLANKDDWVKKPKETRCFVQFHPLITASITALSFRQYDYQLVMSYKHRLSRWLHKRMAHNYIQAGSLSPYRISLSTILRDSGAYLPPRKDNRPREVDTALKELQARDVLMSFTKEYRRGPRNAVVDIVYQLDPDFSFIQEIKRANARAKAVLEPPSG